MPVAAHYGIIGLDEIAPAQGQLPGAWPNLTRRFDVPSISPQSKTCTKCGESKPLSEYYRDKRHTDGRRSDCKECSKRRHREYYRRNREQRLEWQKKYYRENREEILEKDRRYRQENREKIREYNRQYYWDNREKSLENSRQWHEENKEYWREYNRRYYQENREELIEYRRKYYEENTEQVKATNRRWQLENPDKKRTYGHRYLARKNEAPGDFTPEQLQARIDYYGGLCWMCGGPYEEIDHVIPLNDGGTNWPANLRPACKSCNSSKQDKDWREYAEAETEAV